MALGSTKPRFRNISGNWQAAGSRVSASFTTAFAGTNNDLKFTSKSAGANYAGGNSTTIAFVVAGVSTPLTIGVVGSAITVNVATTAGSAASSTSAQVKAAIEASVPANALVTVDHATGNDGTGVVAALGTTSLAGGQDYVIGTGR